VNPVALDFSEACERNRGPILAELRDAFRDCREVLEIGSGTGQHAVHFAAALPGLRWQPSERAPQLPGLCARIAFEGTANIRAPIELDLARGGWPPGPAPDLHWDAAFSANTLHIVAAPLVERFFVGIGATLAPRERLAVYGPFRYRGQFTTDSNERFDASLKLRDPASGIRDAEWVLALAAAQGFDLVADRPMPANNQLLVWQRA
jgi:SAM-dependent methyltransferase